MKNWKKFALFASATSIIGTGLLVLFIKGAHTHEEPTPEDLYEKVNLNPDRSYVLFKNSDKTRLEVDTKGMRSYRDERGDEDVTQLKDWPSGNYAIGVTPTKNDGMILTFFKTEEDKSYFTNNVDNLFFQNDIKAERVYYLDSKLNCDGVMTSSDMNRILAKKSRKAF